MESESGPKLRNRPAHRLSSGSEGDDGLKKEEDGVLRLTNAGKMDVERLISRKMQLKRKAEVLKSDLMRQLDGHFSEFVDTLIEESTLLETPSINSISPETLHDKDSKQYKQLQPAVTRGKVFISRRSLLDELFEVNHIRTIYHMFIALLIIFIISTLIVDFLDEGRLVLDFDLLVYTFGKLPVVICSWIFMFFSTLVVPYMLLVHWARHHHTSNYRTLRTFVYGTAFVLFQMMIMGCGPVYIVLHYDLPPASRFIVIMEQVRMLMKAHSFVRENASRVILASKESTDSPPIPQFSQYLYFLFVPTLVYRDGYPRNPEIRWSYVVTKFLQVFGCLFYVYYIFVRLCIPLFRNMSQEPFSARVLVLCIFSSILPGVLMLFLGFFAVLHCWMNAFAEMLRFADRIFYKDWWNSTSFANYYRTWNVVVHDWLYCYAYRDFLWMFGKRFRAAAMLSVFTVSAIVHEYVLALCFGFFYPVLFCLFMCFGMVFNFILHDRRKGPIWNIIMWTSLFLGQGVLVCLYSQEWYAQRHCPIENPSLLDLVKPRSWTCRLSS